ncbi:MAG TPA: sulfatase-like hydrolase/transferase [Gemmataceae bacterium]|nr:sulfatase-like hydrolase/transferase [Gemmataceae bacterium]
MRVLVLVARGLHLGYAGPYGNDWIETPALDRLAAEGVVFDRHYADVPDPAGAAHAWRTGRYRLPPPAGEDEAMPAADEPDLLALLAAAGVETVLVRKESRPLEETLAATEEELRRLADRDGWLLWVELDTLLPPWEAPEEFLLHYFDSAEDEETAEEDAEGEPLTPLTDPPAGLIDPDDDATFLRLQRTYAGAMTYLDTGLGEFFDALREDGTLNDVLVVFTTDHGLPLGEHGVMGLARPWLHDELIHLPLILCLPGGAEAGRRIPALTQPVDLLPTLLAAFNLPVPAAAHGENLLPLARREKEAVRSYACSGLRSGDWCEWALRTPDWAFLLSVSAPPEEPPRSPQLYGKPDDRWEVNNVVQHHLETADHLERVLRGFAEASRRPGPLAPPGLHEAAADPEVVGKECSPHAEREGPSRGA